MDFSMEFSSTLSAGSTGHKSDKSPGRLKSQACQDKGVLCGSDQALRMGAKVRMIRTYSVIELEELSGVSRRTISDYVAKGLLTGPSHRGRGARYPQSDLDVLNVLPRLRTLMKKEFPNLKSVSAFLRELSPRELRNLARRTSEKALVLEVHRLRVRQSMISVLPSVAPERIDDALETLTPEQVAGIDSGRYQLGAVFDMMSLMSSETAREALGLDGSGPPPESMLAGNGGSESLRLQNLHRVGTRTAVPSTSGSSDGDGQLDDRMTELSRRLERIERLLEVSD